ncbi:MAG: precorrin-8X methylmutase [Hungatella sp.]|jgi:precorrin-8X/cobalt-precorrin-8 methylmutase|nr:precorrin-8X methylmutase [Hungatella sp.]MCI9502755.1 precorrin-8X methylmutase [Hungatella sp.]MCI9635424.1 precorrin-8X methylmutase [Hungatella sp.]
MMELEQILPEDIEKRSFEIIARELGDRTFPPEQFPVIRRVIHTTADFDYADNLVFSDNGVYLALEALREGVPIVTDTNMGKAGINKNALKKYKNEVYCFMSDPDVARKAKEEGTTRAWASMDKAAALGRDCVFAIGNAPTALIRLYELTMRGILNPRLIIGVPVGFVNVIQAKERIMTMDVPWIVGKGRKGGSNVAASICNALLYQLKDDEK